MSVPARELSHQLRRTTDPDLRRRRWVLGLSLVGTVAAQIVTLYQMGMLRRLPDLPVGPFNATKVDAAPYGYSRLQTPDGALMLVSYALTAALAAAGGRDRAERNPALPLALAAKTGWDSLSAVRLAQEEWQQTRALCGYCQSATVASLASLVLALPEAARALRALRR
jgi:uncharacterized membrane protein